MPNNDALYAGGEYVCDIKVRRFNPPVPQRIEVPGTGGRTMPGRPLPGEIEFDMPVTTWAKVATRLQELEVEVSGRRHRLDGPTSTHIGEDWRVTGIVY